VSGNWRSARLRTKEITIILQLRCLWASIFYQLKNGCRNWEDLPTATPYWLFIGTLAVVEAGEASNWWTPYMTRWAGQKKLSGRRWSSTAGGTKYPQRECGDERMTFTTDAWDQAASSSHVLILFLHTERISLDDADCLEMLTQNIDYLQSNSWIFRKLPFIRSRLSSEHLIEELEEGVLYMWKIKLETLDQTFKLIKKKAAQGKSGERSGCSKVGKSSKSGWETL